MTTTGYVFTVKDAATACQVSPRTITRRLPALQDHGASKDDAGVWHIPLGALLAVGLKPGKPAGPDPVSDMSYDSGAVSQDTVTPVVTPDVLAELAALRHRAELAEKLLESERRLTDALSLALRALTPGTSGDETGGDETGDQNSMTIFGSGTTHISSEVQRDGVEPSAIVGEYAPSVSPRRHRRWWQRRIP